MNDDRNVVALIGEELRKAAALRDERKPGKWVTGEDLVGMGIDALPCLIEPIMQKVGLACIAGSSDTGKSSFLRQLCFAVASGADQFLGFRINAQHHSAIYVSTEDDELALCFLLKKQNKDWQAKEADFGQLHFLFDTTDLLHELDAKLEENPADIVCIDAFTDLFSGELNKSNEVRSFLNDYSQLAHKHQCLVIFLHHCGKRTEQERTPSKHNLLGSQAFEAKMRLVLELRSDLLNPGLKHLCIVKGNYLPSTFKNDSFVLGFSENMTFSNTEERTPFEQLVKTAADNNAKEEALRDKKSTARYLQNQGWSQQQIAESMNVNKSTVSRWLKNELDDEDADEQ